MKSSNILLTEQMIQRSVISEGDRSRLYSVIKRAARGETVTFSVIGGSITHGCLADRRNESYAELVYEWWKNKFPWHPVNYIKAGIGATDSYIGVHRVQKDLLVHNPDVVIVEFSVNDTDENINPESYRSLVNRILSHESNPAVILLFTLCRDGSNFRKFHEETGIRYSLPMISYADAVFPEIQSGTFRWEDISPDDIHPSSEGHRIIAGLINAYMDRIYSDAVSSDDIFVSSFNENIKYSGAEMLDNRNIIPVSCNGFKKSSVSSQFPYSWTSEVSGKLEFKVNARNIGIMYYRTVTERSGVYSVYIDGCFAADLDGDFSGGWGDYTAYSEVFCSDIPENHTIEIKKSDSSENVMFTVIAVCIS